MKQAMNVTFTFNTLTGNSLHFISIHRAVRKVSNRLKFDFEK